MLALFSNLKFTLLMHSQNLFTNIAAVHKVKGHYKHM